jgi:hypothetical protein
VTADASGSYSFPGLANGSYTVTPTKSGFTFTPISQTVAINGANAVVPAFTAAAIQTTVTKIFADTAVPATLQDAETRAVELGMKFSADVSGTIRAVRFYKGANNNGPHVGNLWTSTGTLLSSVTFTNETASGWQQAEFPAPVPINANTVYIVSYHAPAGRYSINTGYFANTGVYSAPLYALRNGVSGGNGVYRYGATSFPTQTFQSSNYWVDVVFSSATTNNVTAFPSSTTIETGTPRSGGAAQLSADDEGFYQVNSTTAGTRTSAWYATFTNVPGTIQSLKVAYTGKNSRTCTQTISIWNWATSSWEQLDSRSVGTGEILRSNLAPAGSPASYVGTTGEVRVRVMDTASANFFTSADLISITYAQ